MNSFYLSIEGETAKRMVARLNVNVSTVTVVLEAPQCEAWQSQVDAVAGKWTEYNSEGSTRQVLTALAHSLVRRHCDFMLRSSNAGGVSMFNRS